MLGLVLWLVAGERNGRPIYHNFAIPFAKKDRKVFQVNAWLILKKKKKSERMAASNENGPSNVCPRDGRFQASGYMVGPILIATQTSEKPTVANMVFFLKKRLLSWN